jgi:hypothetical protein
MLDLILGDLPAMIDLGDGLVLFNLITDETYFMEYVDLAGNFSARTIRVIEGGDSFFRAFCYDAKAPRTFDCDGVVNLHKVSSKVGDAMWERIKGVPERAPYIPTRVANVPQSWR